MSTLATPLTDRLVTTWTAVTSTLTVGNRAGDFVGTIERVQGGFVASDGQGQPVGRFRTEQAARAALGRMSGPRITRRRDRTERAGFAVATAAGAIAGALALTAAALPLP